MGSKSKDTRDVQPLYDFVLIKPAAKATTTASGLYIPDTSNEEPQEGEVIAVGPGRREKGVFITPCVSVGQTVLFGKFSGAKISVDNLVIMRETDIFAVVK